MNRTLPEPTAAHRRAIAARGDSFAQFVRNGVWGTCAGCPRDSSGMAYPEFCEDASRQDHHLPFEDLAGAYISLTKTL